jgi:hypothetical protein
MSGPPIADVPPVKNPRPLWRTGRSLSGSSAKDAEFGTHVDHMINWPALAFQQHVIKSPTAS